MRLPLLATLLAVALALVSTASAQARPAPRCNGQAALCSRTFDQVVLAGSHNAMSARSLGWRIPNQSVDIPAQLRYGIRALLFDSHYGRPQPDGTVKTDDDGTVATGGPRGTYFCHVACEIGFTPLVPGLRAIRDWLRAHPRNVLAIDHEDHITPRDFVAAMKASGLAHYAYRGSTRHWPTLSRMIARHQQVVVLAENRAGHAPWYHTAYDGILQETPYTWKQAALITHKANWRASCKPNRGGRTGSLFLLNHWSPDVPPQVPDLAASAKVNARRVLVGRAKACRARRGRLPSIIAVDQVKAGGLLAAVRRLNAMGPR